MIVVCNGMFRGGSTLQYNLTRELVERLGLGEGLGAVQPPELDRLLCEHAGLGQDGPARLLVVKMHPVHPNTQALLASGRIALVYIHRDIRDVAASAKRKTGHRGDALLPLLDPAVEAYHQLRAADGVLWQRYEQVVCAPERAAREIARHLSLEPDPAELRQVVEACSIEAARETARKLGRVARVQQQVNKGMARVPRPLRALARRAGITRVVRRSVLPRELVDERTQLHADHISADAGRVGSYRDVLDAAELSLIEAHYGDFLGDAGYTPAASQPVPG